jgi:hypothetical protein
VYLFGRDRKVAAAKAKKRAKGLPKVARGYAEAAQRVARLFERQGDPVDAAVFTLRDAVAGAEDGTDALTTALGPAVMPWMTREGWEEIAAWFLFSFVLFFFFFFILFLQKSKRNYSYPRLTNISPHPLATVTVLLGGISRCVGRLAHPIIDAGWVERFEAEERAREAERAGVQLSPEDVADRLKRFADRVEGVAEKTEKTE